MTTMDFIPLARVRFVLEIGTLRKLQEVLQRHGITPVKPKSGGTFLLREDFESLAEAENPFAFVTVQGLSERSHSVRAANREAYQQFRALAREQLQRFGRFLLTEKEIAARIGGVPHGTVNGWVGLHEQAGELLCTGNRGGKRVCAVPVPVEEAPAPPTVERQLAADLFTTPLEEHQPLTYPTFEETHTLECLPVPAPGVSVRVHLHVTIGAQDDVTAIVTRLREAGMLR